MYLKNNKKYYNEEQVCCESRCSQLSNACAIYGICIPLVHIFSDAWTLPGRLAQRFFGECTRPTTNYPGALHCSLATAAALMKDDDAIL